MRTSIHLIMLCCLGACTMQMPAHDGAIQTGGFRIKYTIYGSGQPLILLHAGFQDRKMWEEQIFELGRHYCVIAPDLPGHGETTGLDSSLSVADVIRMMMDSLKIEKASFAGLSLGSTCVSEFVLTYPDRVNKIVLVSPGIVGGTRVLPADSLSISLFNNIDSASASGDPIRFARAFTKMWCIGPYRDSSAVDAAARGYVYRTTLLSRNTHDTERLSWRPFAKYPPDRVYSSIRKPTLIIAGDKDVPYIVSIAKYLHGQIPSSQLQIMPGAAHMLNMEKPEAFNKAVLAFLGN